MRGDSAAFGVVQAPVPAGKPRLLVRSPARLDERLARGMRPYPIKVTVTGKGQLDPSASFFLTGDTEKIVYCASATVDRTRERLQSVATVVDGGQPVDMGRLSDDLYDRGVQRLMVEGG